MAGYFRSPVHRELFCTLLSLNLQAATVSTLCKSISYPILVFPVSTDWYRGTCNVLHIAKVLRNVLWFLSDPHLTIQLLLYPKTSSEKKKKTYLQNISKVIWIIIKYFSVIICFVSNLCKTRLSIYCLFWIMFSPDH